MTYVIIFIKYARVVFANFIRDCYYSSDLLQLKQAERERIYNNIMTFK
jgi:hypothetical protein